MDNKLIKQYEETQKNIEDVESKIMAATTQLQKELANLREKDAEMRDKIKEAMEKYNVKKFEGNNITITYVAPTTRTGVDVKSLKEKHPVIYKKFLKTTNVKSSIRITESK